ncbi:unnamed protein product [Camellia sinensis]
MQIGTRSPLLLQDRNPLLQDRNRFSSMIGTRSPPSPPRSEPPLDEKVAKDTIRLQVFAPPSNGFDVDVLRIMVELLPESSTPTQMIMASTLGREFIKTFYHQVFTEYQRVLFAYKGSSYACSVVKISLGENEESESLRSPKQELIKKRTKVIVEGPPQSL